MLTALMVGAGFGAIIGACTVSHFDECRYGHIEKRLIQSQAELASAKKERALCEAEIEHLKLKRDSRGRFRKG